jgi:hypothetical protein
MNPLLIIAIPLGLVVLGMILNSLDLGFVQPPSSPEQDPVKRSAAESASYRKFFEQQRSRAMTADHITRSISSRSPQFGPTG